MAALGAGQPSLAVKKWTAERLTAAPAEAARPLSITRAGQVGAMIRREDGVGEAVNLVKRLILKP